MAGFMSRLSERPRALTIRNDEDVSVILGQAGVSTTGIRIDTATALSVAAVFACVRVVSEDVAKLPIDLYRRLPGGGKEKAVDHPKHELVNSRPNAVQTDYEWKEMMQGHIELRGDAFSFITRYNGEIRELIPIHPDKVTVEKDRQLYIIRYRVDGTWYTDEQILHLRGMSSDGVRGMTPIQVHRETIGLAVATAQHGARFFRNGAKASGVAQHPNLLDEGAAERLKESLEQALSGDNIFRVLVLEEGMQWKQLQITNEDAQFLETKRHSWNEICGIWRVPPHKTGELTDATYSNIHAQERAYIQDSLNPRLVRLEKRLGLALLTREEQRQYFYEFNRNALLEGLTKERYEALEVAFRNGIVNRDEWRGMENLNPVTGGQTFFVNRNLAALREDGTIDPTSLASTRAAIDAGSAAA